MKIDRTKTGEEIRRLRARKKLSQAELAQNAGITQCQLSRIENGKDAAKDSTLEKIAKALSVAPEQLACSLRKEEKGAAFEPYQVTLICKAISMRIEDEARKLADGMNVKAEDVLRCWRKNFFS